jgi:hypothetical protein
MDPVFELRLRELQQQAAVEGLARAMGEQAEWMRPSDWTGSVFAYEAMATPFSRQVSNIYFVSAVSNPSAPGTTGDLIAATTMVDFLACMERAFRQRHTMTRPRAVAHAMGRKLGHGNDQGPLVTNTVEYIRAVLKQAKAS